MLKNSMWISIILGIVCGALCALLDLIPNDNIWTFSSFSGSLGFWAITGMIIVMQYEKRWKSAVGTFIYFAVMNTSFFIVHYLISPMFRFPRISKLSVALNESVLWLIPSVICGVCALVVFNAKKDDILGTIVLALPMGLLLYEAICLVLSIIINHKYLFQTIIDIIGILVLWYLYSKRKNKIALGVLTIIVAGSLLIAAYILYSTILFI